MDDSERTASGDGETEGPDPLAGALRHAFETPAGETAGDEPADSGTEVLAAAFLAAGRYRLVEEIGRGGMGAVYRAEDSHLRREVAIKVLHRGAADPERAGRFEEEARIAAQLQHPAIVPVHDLGEIAGRPFLSMKLVTGVTLHEALRGGGRDARPIGHWLDILERVAQATAFAHARGVVHRDLKPANVMLGGAGEVQVMDWGLAKVVGTADAGAAVSSARGDDPRLVSLSGRVMGTPAYMAPEQARGDVDAVGLAADVFSLGAMLCEVLLGRPVYRGTTSEEVREQAAAAETAEVLTALEAAGHDAELVSLARRCLAEDPQQRPQDAAAVASAMARHREAVELRAEQARLDLQTAELRATHERGRRRLVMAIAAVLLVAITLGLGALWWNETQRRDRELTTGRQVGEARARAERLVAEARSATSDTALAAWREARAAAAEVAGVARAGTPDAATRESATRFAARIREEADREIAAQASAQRDEEMVTTLDHIRLERTLPPDPEAISAAYEAAFDDYGIDVQQADAGEALAASPIADRLTAALDDWIVHARLFQKMEDPRLKALRSLLGQADDHPLRSEVRSELLTANVTRLREIAAMPEALELPAALLQLMAAAFHRRDSLAAATDLLRRACHRRPDSFYLCFDLAHLLGLEEPPRHVEAIAWYNAALALKDHRNVRAERALAMVSARRFSDALAEAATLEARYGPNATSCLVRGRVSRSRGKVEEASAAFEQAIALDPKDYAARISLANLHWEAGRLDEAQPLYEQAQKNGAPADHINYLLGNLYRKRGNHKRAMRFFRNATLHRAQYQRAWHQLALTFADLHMPEGSIKTMRRAIEIEPTNATAHHNLGHFLKQTLQFDAARESYRRAIALSGNDARLRARFEKSLSQVDRDEAQVDLLERILARQADPPPGGWLPFVQLCLDLRQPALEADLWRHVETYDPAVLDNLASGAAGRALTAAAHAALGRGFDGVGRDRRDRKADSALAKRMFARLLKPIERRAKGSRGARRRAHRSLEKLLARQELASLRDPNHIKRIGSKEVADWCEILDKAQALLEELEED